MRPKNLDIDPIDVDADGIAESQTPAAGGAQALTLDGVLSDLGTAGVFDIADTSYSSDIAGVRIGITCAGDETGRTFTIVGTDYYDTATSEAVTGVNAAVAESVAYFKTISSITVDNDTAGAITVGPVDEVVSKTVPLNFYASPFEVGLFADVTGTIDFTIQHTGDSVLSGVVPTWFNHDTMTSQTADADGNYVIPVTATRVVINSYNSGAELSLDIVQSK